MFISVLKGPKRANIYILGLRKRQENFAVFSDLFMLNRRLIIIIILIIGKVFYYYLFIIIYYLLLFILLLLLLLVFCFYFGGAVIKRYAKFLTRYVKGVPLDGLLDVHERGSFSVKNDIQ